MANFPPVDGIANEDVESVLATLTAFARTYSAVDGPPLDQVRDAAGLITRYVVNLGEARTPKVVHVDPETDDLLTLALKVLTGRYDLAVIHVDAVGRYDPDPYTP